MENKEQHVTLAQAIEIVYAPETQDSVIINNDFIENYVYA